MVKSCIQIVLNQIDFFYNQYIFLVRLYLRLYFRTFVQCDCEETNFKQNKDSLLNQKLISIILEQM